MWKSSSLKKGNVCCSLEAQSSRVTSESQVTVSLALVTRSKVDSIVKTIHSISNPPPPPLLSAYMPIHSKLLVPFYSSSLWLTFSFLLCSSIQLPSFVEFVMFHCLVAATPPSFFSSFHREGTQEGGNKIYFKKRIPPFFLWNRPAQLLVYTVMLSLDLFTYIDGDCVVL